VKIQVLIEALAIPGSYIFDIVNPFKSPFNFKTADPGFYQFFEMIRQIEVFGAEGISLTGNGFAGGRNYVVIGPAGLGAFPPVGTATREMLA
jgi:hypothetical protein